MDNTQTSVIVKCEKAFQDFIKLKTEKLIEYRIFPLVVKNADSFHSDAIKKNHFEHLFFLCGNRIYRKRLKIVGINEDGTIRNYLYTYITENEVENELADDIDLFFRNELKNKFDKFNDSIINGFIENMEKLKEEDFNFYQKAIHNYIKQLNELSEIYSNKIEVVNKIEGFIFNSSNFSHGIFNEVFLTIEALKNNTITQIDSFLNEELKFLEKRIVKYVAPELALNFFPKTTNDTFKAINNKIIDIYSVISCNEIEIITEKAPKSISLKLFKHPTFKRTEGANFSTIFKDFIYSFKTDNMVSSYHFLNRYLDELKEDLETIFQALRYENDNYTSLLIELLKKFNNSFIKESELFISEESLENLKFLNKHTVNRRFYLNDQLEKIDKKRNDFKVKIFAIINDEIKEIAKTKNLLPKEVPPPQNQISVADEKVQSLDFNDILKSKEFKKHLKDNKKAVIDLLESGKQYATNLKPKIPKETICIIATALSETGFVSEDLKKGNRNLLLQALTGFTAKSLSNDLTIKGLNNLTERNYTNAAIYLQNVINKIEEMKANKNKN